VSSPYSTLSGVLRCSQRASIDVLKVSLMQGTLDMNRPDLTSIMPLHCAAGTIRSRGQGVEIASQARPGG